MFRRCFSSIAAQSLLLLCPCLLMAQRHGGHSGANIPGGISRPDGVQEKDDLKDFDRALAVQATSQQIADFQALVTETDAAKANLETFVQDQGKVTAGARPTVSISDIDQLLQQTLVDSRKFVEGFSAAQKSGLKDDLKKLSKADSELEAENKKLDNTVQSETQSSAGLESLGQSLTKSLATFSDQQLALGREMGILLAQGSDVTFNLPEIKNPVKVGDTTIDVTTSGELSQIAAQGPDRTFRVQVMVDLSEFRENLTAFLRPRLSAGRTCGERLELRQATMTPSAPASVVNLSLHYERWSCMGGTSQEVAESDGSVEVKLHPSFEKPNSIKLAGEFSRVDGSGLMAESLRSGSLGEDLRAKLSESVLEIAQSGIDFEKLLPAVVRPLAEIQGAKFEDTGVGRLAFELDGQMQITDAQANLMASQLNQALFAKGAASKDGDTAKAP